MESARIKELIDEIADGNISRFAQRVGVNRVTVHRWLKGESTPRGLALEKLGKLAKRRKNELPCGKPRGIGSVTRELRCKQRGIRPGRIK